MIAADVRPNVEDVVLRHLDCAYRVARWRVQDADLAAEVVMSAFQLGLQRMGSFTGGDGRVWFLRIVSELCHKRGAPPRVAAAAPVAIDAPPLEAAIGRLPDELREALVLRELEGLSYRELSEVMGVPLETAMSRLSRARQEVAELLVLSEATA